MSYTSRPVILAVAIRDFINALTSLTIDVTAVVKIAPILKVGEAASAQVTVWVPTRSRSIAGRGLAQEEPQVMIGIEQNLPSGTDPSSEDALAWVDARLKLVDDILDAFDPGDSIGGATIKGLSNEPYNIQAIHESRLFASLITITFRGYKTT